MKHRISGTRKPFAHYPSWLYLSDHDAHQGISQQLAPLIPETLNGYTCDQPTVRASLLKASGEGRAIEGTCNDLAAAPTGITLRGCLNEIFPITALQVIERKLQTFMY